MRTASRFSERVVASSRGSGDQIVGREGVSNLARQFNLTTQEGVVVEIEARPAREIGWLLGLREPNLAQAQNFLALPASFDPAAET